MESGVVVGGYQIEGLIGAGGMGAVYQASHQLLGRKAAIKVLLPHFSTNQAVVQRFFDEARASTQIQHPGIVQIFDFGYHTDGLAYIVMEFLRGESLEARLKRERTLDPETAKRIVVQIASALGAAHNCGIVHRDLKPENVFLVPDPAVLGGERAKLLDFGIAKLTSPGETTKTKTGTIMGTPVYMAPEQCRGANLVDGRADIYSLGCMLFQLLTGRPPFNYPSVGELMAAHLGEAPPIASHLGAPLGFDPLLRTTLSKSADDRYQTMGEFVSALETADTSRSAHQPSGAFANVPPSTTTLAQASGVSQATFPATTKRRVWPWVLGGGLLLVAASAAAMLIVGDGPASSPAETTTAVAPADIDADASLAAPAIDAALVPADEGPAVVKVTITSKPAGAEVRLGSEDGKVIGLTPLKEAEVQVQASEASNGDAEYWVVMPEHEPLRIRSAANSDVVEAVVLVKTPKPAVTATKRCKYGKRRDGSCASSRRRPRKPKTAPAVKTPKKDNDGRERR